MEIPPAEHQIRLIVEPPALASLAFLLMEGVELEAPPGCTVQEFLCDRIGLNRDYVTDRIQTVFLNGSPVDRPDRAVLEHGSVLALSAALPGLLGATLRKSGHYASLRRGITHVETPQSSQEGSGLVVVKAFNVLIPELAPTLLESGVFVTWGRIDKILRRGGPRLISAVLSSEIDGTRLPPGDMADPAWPGNARVLLSVSTADRARRV
jgi:hypothetical protein